MNRFLAHDQVHILGRYHPLGHPDEHARGGVELWHNGIAFVDGEQALVIEYKRSNMYAEMLETHTPIPVHVAVACSIPQTLLKENRSKLKWKPFESRPFEWKPKPQTKQSNVKPSKPTGYELIMERSALFRHLRTRYNMLQSR
jgi:hypothetical protein